MKKVQLREYKDQRGSLVENTAPEILEEMRHFFISKSKPGIIRGNHYHKRKLEWFLVVKGKAELYIEDIKTKERKEYSISAEENLLLRMEPLKAHAIRNVGKEELILLAIINEVFNRQDPDTYDYKIL